MKNSGTETRTGPWAARSVWRVAAVVAVGCHLGYFPGAGAGAFGADVVLDPLEPVPSPLYAATDRNGAPWTIGRAGHIENSGDKLINQAQVLRINGSDFSPERAMKGRDTTRWMLGQRVAEFEVTRDVFFDAGRGGVRYVDTFKNTGKAEAQANIEYYSSLRYPWLQLYTAQGREFEEKLGTRDTGIFVKMPEDREHQGILFLLAGERSSHKPGIEIESNNQVRVRFTLAVPAGGMRSVAYWVAQRRVTDPGEIKAVTDEFYRQRLLTDAMIPREVAGGIANFDMTSGGAGQAEPHNESLLVALRELGARVGVIRTGQDVLWVGRDSQLSGEVEGGPVRFASRFGEVTAELAEVAAIQGGGGRGRQQKIYLRDGTVLQAQLAVEGLRLKGADGWMLDLDVAQIEYLFGRVAEADGRVDGEINLFVRLHSGDVCGIAAKEEDALQFMTPWGEFAVPLTRIEVMSYLKSPSPRYRVELKDGSRITAFLVDGPLSLQALRFGGIQLSASEISGMWTVAGEIPEVADEIREIEDFGATQGPACLLKGDNLIAGRLASDQLHVVSGTTVTALKPGEIVAMRRTYEEESELLPVFEIELKGGDILIGTLREDTLRIESGHLAWNVPVQHFLAMQIPVAPED